MPNLVTTDADVNKLYAEMEKQIESEPLFDHATLTAVHEYWEFIAPSDLSFDAWIHAHIKKALRARRAAKESQS